MLNLSHDGIAEDADLVSVWDRLAEKFERKHSFTIPCAWETSIIGFGKPVGFRRDTEN
jgi:hypothetical protein